MKRNSQWEVKDVISKSQCMKESLWLIWKMYMKETDI